VSTVLAAAVQLDARLGDVAHNLAACEELADRAGNAGAQIIALPEFFATGIGFDPGLVDAALPPDGAAGELLHRLAVRHRALVGGSFLCRDPDGQVRNAYLLVGPGGPVGRHDKDAPTMWENAFYTGGGDSGLITARLPDGEPICVGAAVCWELMRAGTARRLRGAVDLMMTGSGWWSIPPWPPRPLFAVLERRNRATARAAAAEFAPLVGAPLVHAAHCGPLECATPWLPLRYRGQLEGATLIAAADGTVLAERGPDQGPGVVLAEVAVGRTAPARPIPQRYWLHRRGVIPAVSWHYQRLHGRRWYRRHVVGR
jgi:predicted amidohydrolase